MNNLILSFLFLFITLFSSAQKIENIRTEQQAKKINIYYDITGTETGQTFDVKVYCSTDGGASWDEPLQSVTGDVGKNVTTGCNKKIVWDVLKDREKLQGDKIQFEIRAKVTGGASFTDLRDGQSYKTVKIGTQIWFAENLNYATSSGSWCYDDNSSNCSKYGRLYDWKTAKKSCPGGWHLPTDAEWTTLTDYLGGEKIAGGKMKSKSYWDSPNTGATNSSGFTALPGGGSWSGSFYNVGDYGGWWSASEYDASDAWHRHLSFSYATVFRYNTHKLYGFSVRCVKD
jgi:uncharacterized protein (TIGR02145 family)